MTSQTLKNAVKFPEICKNSIKRQEMLSNALNIVWVRLIDADLMVRQDL